MGDIELTSAELDEQLVAFVAYGPLRSYDHVALMERVLGPSLVSAEEVRDRLGNLTGWNLIIRRLARSGLEARKAEESMRERAAKLVFDAVTQEDSAQVANKLFNLVPAIRALPLTEGGDKP